MARSDPSLNLDPLQWHPQYTTCLLHFINNSQHSPPVKSIATFINIRLPYQRQQTPIHHVSDSETKSDTTTTTTTTATSSFISLRLYIRRLVVTGRDSSALMQALFGDDWIAGVGPIRQQERVNYLFAAKSSGWAATKAAYDIAPDEQVPFLRPLAFAEEEEIRLAEAKWSEWLAMEDWMVGPRCPW